MRTKTRTREQGIAMVTALMAALLVSITAAVVLNMTLRRFELSAFRTDHTVATHEAEAGLQYAFARLARDGAFRTAVQNKQSGGRQAYYALSCNPNADVDPVTPGVQLPDEQVSALHMGGTLTPPAVDGTGGKHAVVRIIFGGGLGLPAGEPALPPGAQYRVRATTDFGTGA